jgi:uncharacterized LabA/DUF88 family protein
MAHPMTATNNFAFIDSQNLNLSIQQLGWKLDFYRFRKYLAEKYSVTRAFIFVGYVEDNQELYDHLAKVGYELVYKPTLAYKDGTTKGNVDAELVLHTMIEWNNYDRAVIVSGDGDFYSLVEYLISADKLSKLIVPNKYNYSSLLKRFDSQYLAFVSDLRSKMRYFSRRKEPQTDQPVEGASPSDDSSLNDKSNQLHDQ